YCTSQGFLPYSQGLRTGYIASGYSNRVRTCLGQTSRVNYNLAILNFSRDSLYAVLYFNSPAGSRNFTNSRNVRLNSLLRECRNLVNAINRYCTRICLAFKRLASILDGELVGVSSSCQIDLIYTRSQSLNNRVTYFLACVTVNH